MPLESATVIPQLDPDNPLGTDPISNGDNHVRLIKEVLVNQLGSLGTGLLSVTAEQINTAAASAGQYSTGTSTTSLLIGAGTKTFTTQANRGFAVGQRINLTSQADVANYMAGICTAYNSTTGAMTITADEFGGSGTFADWSVFVDLDIPLPQIVRTAITGATTLNAANRGQLIDMSGTFTLGFDNCATLGSGWYAYVRNSGTGDITYDPAASDTIDGLTSFISYPQEARLVTCDGTALRSIVLNGFYRAWTSLGSFTKPPGYTVFGAEVIAAGGGGRSGAASIAGGGSGGQCVSGMFAASLFAATETLTVAGTVAANTNGGNSSIGTVIIANGGSAGGTVGTESASVVNFSDNSTRVAAGTANIGAAAQFPGTSFGMGGAPANTLAGARGGDTSTGGGGGGGATNAGLLGTKGISRKHGSGGDSVASGTPNAGTAPGGGGGGNYNGTGGGGARGEIRIWG